MEKDYIMRIIQEIIRLIAWLVFEKDTRKGEHTEVPAEVLEQYKTLLAMMDDGEINMAENLLMNSLDLNNSDYFQMAFLFYQKLNEKPEAFLEEHQYTRQEVLDGIVYVIHLYGYGSFLEAFINSEASDIPGGDILRSEH